MKKPILFISILSITIVCSTVLVSTTISGICRSFYKSDTEKNFTVKAVPVDNQLKEEIKQASITVKF
jgi:hypothetical protein